MSSKFESTMNQLGISEQLKMGIYLILMQALSVSWFIKVVRFGNFILYFLKFCLLKSFWS